MKRITTMQVDTGIKSMPFFGDQQAGLFVLKLQLRPIQAGQFHRMCQGTYLISLASRSCRELLSVVSKCGRLLSGGHRLLC